MPTQKQPSCEKGRGPMQKGQGEKSCATQVVVKKWL